MSKPPRLDDAHNYAQAQAYSPVTAASSPQSPVSTPDAVYTPRAASQAPAAAQGIALRPSNLAPSIAANNGYQPMPSGPTCSGPMSSSVAVPARPKPGRKAATDEPDNKRKAQNRAAQRAFRERKTNVQKGLEYDNNILKAQNDQISAELNSLRAQAEHDRSRIAALLQEVAEATARENESRAKWENNLSSLAAFQLQRQEAETRADEALAEARRCKDEVQRMTMELNTYKSRVSQVPNQPSTASAQASNHGRPQVSIQVIPKVPQKRQLVPDGCGNCEENGACPCVDSYIDDPEPSISRDGAPSLNRNMSTASMSITNLLSPSGMSSSRNNSQSDVPELTSDQSSPEEFEIDFTNHFSRVHTTTHIQNSDRCGFCSDPSNCFCADAEASLQAVKPMAPPVKIKPGTCAQCQQNPEQKAYCEGLALQTKAEREMREGQPDPKRTRTLERNVTMGCADAFAIYKQVTTKPGARPSFDDVYNTFMNSNPPSRRGTDAFANDMEIKPRQFSAYETNIAAVLTTLSKDFRKNSMNGKPPPMPHQTEERPRLQPRMMGEHDLRRPSTAPQFANPFYSDVKLWPPDMSSEPMTGFRKGNLTTSFGQTSAARATPGIFAAPLAIVPPGRNDLLRYSLSIPNSAPASPAGKKGDTMVKANA